MLHRRLRGATVDHANQAKPKSDKQEIPPDEKPAITLSGTVEKIIPSIHPGEPEKAQITIEGADDLYREIRIENTLKDSSGEDVVLKRGDEVDVTIEADPTLTERKDSKREQEQRSDDTRGEKQK
jgi:hypothetical protein